MRGNVQLWLRGWRGWRGILAGVGISGILKFLGLMVGVVMVMMMSLKQKGPREEKSGAWQQKSRDDNGFGD